MRADFDPNIYVADASPFGLGVVGTEWRTFAISELWRRAEVRGRTRNLLYPLSAVLREMGDDGWDDLLAAEDVEEDLAAGRTDHRGVFDEPEQAASSKATATNPAVTRPGGGLDPSLNSIDRKATTDLHGPPPDRFPVCFHVIEVCGGIGGIG